RDHQDAERRKRATDVRNVDRKVAEAAVVPQGDAERQRDQRPEQDGLAGKLQVLDQTGWDSIGPVPVRGVSEPLPNRLENAHACRAHGNAYRWPAGSDPSRVKAGPT